MSALPHADLVAPECRTPVLHVDMDAFYASVAVRDDPALAQVPVVVGGGGRGVVLSANYLARSRGVTSAMPMTRARRLCPDAVVLAPDFDLYAQVSAAVLENFREVTGVVEMVSVDEAFLDVSGSARQWGSPRRIAEWLRSRIHDEQRITCSVGIAPSPTLAKIASRRAKPDGVFTVDPDEILEFLHPLDVGELWGVGEKTRTLLHRLGLRTVGQVARTPLPTLHRALGAAVGTHLYELAHGVDRRVVVAKSGPHAPEASVGADHTFEHDVIDASVTERELLRLSAKVATRMRAGGVAGRTVTIRVRFSDFTTITRSRTVSEPTDVTLEIHRTAVALLRQLGLQRARVRLVGVRVSGLVPRSRVQTQMELGQREQGWSDAERAVDAAARRFGSAVVGPASLLAR
ncbi:DNA polymerase IV [Nocardioides yefusunii]|uniref:DNA polymerase IV n=1 Tax=Nocardioides yefusunii TaxID=2500546 RepID=A0ABW1QW71_9ACTN|nr:DNA polymerase IV [Nocardioides yefusunii]